MRNLPRKYLVPLAIVLVALVAFTLYSQLSISPTSGPWVSGFSYPLQTGGSVGIMNQACVDSAGYVYCVGGQDANDVATSAVYFAPASLVGVGNWSASGTSYPLPVVLQSCVSSSGYAYCVGGTSTNGSDTSTSYYSALSASGTGPWVQTTPYPVPTDALSCSAAATDIYCVGGENQTAGSAATPSLTSTVWYAPISSSGIGGWVRSDDYPSGVYFPSCAALSSYVYCVGGEDGQDTPLNATYYSYVTPGGMGQWTAAPDYPIKTIAESCVASPSSLYCVGGLQSGGTTTSSVYYAQVAKSGLGPWLAAPQYPIGVQTDCAAGPGFLYCVGGYDSASGPTGTSYYARLNATASSSSSA